ncbi:MAG: beta-lactamase family protein, partial [Chloroflexi bacterium]|nr:beta-lactamase family protein [Chloroflexota bacterium]
MTLKLKPALGATLIFILTLMIACGSDATDTPSPTATATPEPPPPTVSTDYSSVTAELSEQIQGIVDATGITGLSIALVDDQEMVWAEGFGFADKENGIKATPETVYGVASVSKLFTATAIMQLAENGKLDIDQPLQNQIPGFSINSRFADSDSITARNTMTHHSGLPGNLLSGMVTTGDNEVPIVESAFDGLMQEIETEYVTRSANTTFAYSNLGYGVLGHAVEQSSGQGFIKYTDEAILRPLGMNSSSFTITPEIEQLRSKEYRNGEEVTHVWFRDLPAGALSTNVEDLSRFMMMVFGEGELDDQRILKAETLAEMLTPQHGDIPLDLDVQWGLGWWLIPAGLDYAGRNAWHSGGEGMWNSLLYTLPDHKLGVVVLTNSAEGAGPEFQIATTVLEQALAAKTGLEKPKVEAPEVISLSANESNSYTGRYTTSLGRMDVRVDGDDLYVDVLGTSFKLLPHPEGQFSIEGLPWSEAQMTIRTVEGRTVLKLFGFAVGGLGFGERIEPSPVPQAWLDRLGAYENSNGKAGFTDFFSGIQLRYEDDFLVMDFRCAIECERIVFPIGTISDDEAVILGVGRFRGETVNFVEIDGEEHLAYSGYLFRKLAAAVIPDQQPLTGDVLAGFTKYIEESVERWNVPGTAVAVVADGEVVYAEGFGVREIGKDDPVTPDTLFGIGSMTKSINTMMLASLVDDGFFEWGTPAVEIWPDFQMSHPDSTLAVTVRDLVSMQSGMRRDDSLWIGKGLSAEDLMIALADVPVAGAPGEQHYYATQGVATGAYLGAMAAGGE